MNKIKRQFSRPHAGFLPLAAFCFLIFLSCSEIKLTTIYDRGAVATAAPIATEVGVKILRAGGNAFDAAVAIGFVLAVVHPEAGNIGGGGFALIREGSTGEIRALDFREKAPLTSDEQMFLDSTGEVIPGQSLDDALSSGVPGTVAGLYELWEKYGSMPWEELVNSSAVMADSGFILDDDLVQSFSEHRTKLTRYDETAELFFTGGTAYKSGQRFIQADLAGTLYLLAAEGKKGFYSGATAEKIVESMAQHNGLISMEDLASYRPIWREPVSFSFDNYQIYSMPPPSSGELMIGQILKILEPYDFGRYVPKSDEYIHLFAEASKLSFADRSVHLGDPDFYQVPQTLLDSVYLQQRRTLIDLEHAARSTSISSGAPPVSESDQTTHFSVCDSSGNIVAITYTLNRSYGSGLVVKGAGFLLNNEMDDFSAKPNSPNSFGLIGGVANRIEPGKRMLSSMSPTIVLENNKPRLVLGTPGGSKIITTVAQALINFSRFGLTPSEICGQPRFHHQWLPDLLYIEQNEFDINVMQGLIRRGHNIQEREPYGDLNVIEIGENGEMIPACDPRGRGSASGY